MLAFIHRGCWHVYKRPFATVVASITLLIVAAAANVDFRSEDTFSSFENLKSTLPRTRDKAVDAILHDRSATIQKLIPLIDPVNAVKYSDETRCAAAYLLGELRAEEAVPMLSCALSDEPGPKVITDESRYDMPVISALLKIGRPTVPTMIKNLETTDHRKLRDKSLGVLNHVLGGKRRLLELLAKLEDRAKDKEIRRRIGECIKLCRETYKEDKEPLY